MQVAFSVHETSYTSEALDEGESGDTQVHTSGVDTVKDIVRYAVCALGISKRNNTVPFFVSTHPVEDRDYFEKGIEKFYTLHFPLLSPRALLRVDQMFSILRKETPDVL